MRPEEFQARYHLSTEAMAGFRAYADLLHKWQKSINLVGPSTVEDLWLRHFHDSARLAAHIPASCKTLVDLGSGAGFPGMVLAMLRSDLDIHLVDSDQRKCEFLKAVSRGTGIKVSVHCARVRDALAGLTPDLITARAFAPLVRILDDIPAGMNAPLLLLKGQGADGEIAEAQARHDFSCRVIEDGEGAILMITRESESS